MNLLLELEREALFVDQRMTSFLWNLFSPKIHRLKKKKPHSFV